MIRLWRKELCYSFIWLHVESYQKIKIVKISVFMLTSSCVRQECTFELTTTILHGIQSAAHRWLNSMNRNRCERLLICNVSVNMFKQWLAFNGFKTFAASVHISTCTYRLLCACMGVSASLHSIKIHWILISWIWWIFKTCFEHYWFMKLLAWS